MWQQHGSWMSLQTTHQKHPTNMPMTNSIATPNSQRRRPTHNTHTHTHQNNHHHIHHLNKHIQYTFYCLFTNMNMSKISDTFNQSNTPFCKVGSTLDKQMSTAWRLASPENPHQNTCITRHQIITTVKPFHLLLHAIQANET